MTAIEPEYLQAWRALLSCWDAWLLTLALAAAVPLLGYFRVRGILASPRPIPRRSKLALYGKIVFSQWLLVTAMLLILRHHGLSAHAAGQRLANASLTLGVTLALLFILACVSAIVLVRIGRAQPANLTRGIGRLQKLAPASGVEMAAFAGVCLTAGICEELLYRGWLVKLLQAATDSTLVAVVAGAVLFGLGHASQGAIATLRTAFIGLQLGFLFVWVGSLIPGQVLHAGFDLMIAVAAARAMSRVRSAEVEPPSPVTPNARP